MGYCFLLQLHILLFLMGWAVFNCVYILVFMFTYYIDSHACFLIFTIPMWLLCNWFNICICNWEFFFLLWPHHLSLLICVWWANISVCLVPHHLFCVAIVITLPHLYPLSLPIVCGLWGHYFMSKAVVLETSSTHVGFQVSTFQCCCIITPCWIGSCWQMQTSSCPQFRLSLTCSRSVPMAYSWCTSFQI